MNSRRRWRLRPPRVCIWLCRSGMKAGDAPPAVPNDAAERRRRVYALLEAADPVRGRAVRWCESALGMFRSDSDMREARLLLRTALAAGVHYPTVYRAWTATEADHAGDAPPRGRSSRSGAPGTTRPTTTATSCRIRTTTCSPARYIAFELDHRDAARARAVAELVVAKCRRDPAVHARYAKAELRLGRADRARAVLDCFDADAGAREWQVDQVKRYSNSIRRRRRFRRLCGFIPRFFRGGWWSRLPRGSERVDGAT